MNLRAVRAQAVVELALTLRRGESLLVALGIPVGVLLFFSTVDVVSFDGAGLGVRNDVDFLVPGVLALAVMSSAMVSLGIATGFERRYGVLKRLGSTPLGRGALVTAKILNVLALQVVQFVVLIAVGVALGWSPGSGGVGLVVAVPVMLLGVAAFAGIGLLMAGTLRAEGTLALANGLYLVLLLLGGMAFPLERLPDALQSIAQVLPASALAECLRGAMNSGVEVSARAIGVLTAWAVLAPLAAVHFFRWEE